MEVLGWLEIDIRHHVFIHILIVEFKHHSKARSISLIERTLATRFDAVKDIGIAAISINIVKPQLMELKLVLWKDVHL